MDQIIQLCRQNITFLHLPDAVLLIFYMHARIRLGLPGRCRKYGKWGFPCQVPSHEANCSEAPWLDSSQPRRDFKRISGGDGGEAARPSDRALIRQLKLPVHYSRPPDVTLPPASNEFPASFLTYIHPPVTTWQEDNRIIYRIDHQYRDKHVPVAWEDPGAFF